MSSSYTTAVDPHIAPAPAFSILAEALSTFQPDAPSFTSALSSLSASQPTRPDTITKATHTPSHNDPNAETGDMASLTPAAPTATPIDGGIIPLLATIGSIIVLTGDGYTVTAAIPSANTNALAFVSATLSPGGEAVTMSDAIYSFGPNGLQAVASGRTVLLRQSTYGSAQTESMPDASESVPTIVTTSTSSAEETMMSTTTASTTAEETPSATSDAASATSTEASAGQRRKVTWSVAGIAILAAVIYAL